MRLKLSPTLTVILIKLCLIAGVLVVIWPLPHAIAFQSPDPAVLGRWTLKYFGLLSGLIGLTAVWLAAAGWALLRLNARSLPRLRAWLGEHAGLALAVMSALVGGLALARAGLLSLLLIVPGTLTETMTVVPGLIIFLSVALAWLVVDEDLLARVEAALAWLPGWRTVGLIAGAGLLLVVIAGIALDARYWDHPITIDTGLHIYIGQHILRGGIAYQTFLYHYPPFRFWLSALWSLGASVIHVPVLQFVRGYDLLISAGLLAAIYAVGRKLTGTRSLGLLAALLYLGTEHIQDMLIFGPTFRQTTILFSLLGIGLAQRRRWFWAGLLGVCGAMLYNPSIIAPAAIFVVALLQDEEPRWQAALRVAGGVLAVIGVSALALLIIGNLSDATRQAVLSLFLEVRGLIVPGAEAGKSLDDRTLIEALPWYVSTFRWILRGDWEIVALALGGTVLLLVRDRFKALRTPESGPLLIASGLTAVYLLMSFDGSYRDSALLLVTLMPLGVVPFTLLLDSLHGQKALRRALPVACFAAVALLALPDTVPYQDYQYSLASISYTEQQAEVAQLEAVLQPGDTVLDYGNLWYLMISGRDNPVPFREPVARYIPHAEEITGWTYQRMVDALDAHRPVLILDWHTESDVFDEWASTYYDYLGEYDPDNRGFAQQVYVLKDRPDVRAVVENWPLTEPIE